MRNVKAILLLTPFVVAACSSNPDKRTLAELHGLRPDLQDVQVEDGLDKAMESYRRTFEQGSGDSSFILDPNNDYLRQFRGGNR